MMDESARLLAMQQQLEKESDGKVKFFGQSVSQTIRTCLMNGMSKKADKVKSEFKVPDKRWVFLPGRWLEFHGFFAQVLVYQTPNSNGPSGF